MKPAGQRQLSADEQAAQDREEARAKEPSLPPVLSARLQEAHKAHGRDVKRSVVERSIANEKANNTGTPKAKRERADRIARLEADLALFDEAAAMPPKEAAGPASIPATIGANSEPTPSQAKQASPQPAQAAAPAAKPAPELASAPAPAGAPEVRALNDGAPAQNTGAQSSTAAGAQGKAPRATPEQLTEAGAAWTRMPTAERQALAERTDVKPVLKKNLPGAQWENLHVDVQRRLAAAMAPQADGARGESAPGAAGSAPLLQRIDGLLSGQRSRKGGILLARNLILESPESQRLAAQFIPQEARADMAALDAWLTKRADGLRVGLGAQQALQKRELAEQRANDAVETVKAQALQASAQMDARVASAFTGKPDPMNSVALNELDGFKPGDSVDVSSRTIGRSTVELVFRRQMSGFGAVPMARIVGANGKKLDVLLSELTHVDQKHAADATAASSLIQAAKDSGKLEVVHVGDKKPAKQNTKPTKEEVDNAIEEAGGNLPFADQYATVDALNAAVRQAKKNAAADLSLDEQLKQVNDQLANQGAVQNANTRAKRDQIRTAIAERDFPTILKAVDGNVDMAEAINQALQFAGDEPKAKVIERVLKNRGISDEYRQLWAERLMDGETSAASADAAPAAETKPATVVIPPAIEAALDADMQAQKARITRLRNAAVTEGQTLEQKKTAQTQLKGAEFTLQTMRRTRFDAEDAALKAIEQKDMAPFAEHIAFFKTEKALQEMLGAAGKERNPDGRPKTAADKAMERIAAEDAADRGEALRTAAAPAKPAPKNKPNADQTRAKADLMNALADLGDILGKNARMNIMPEQEQRLLPVLTRVLDAAFRLG